MWMVVFYRVGDDDVGLFWWRLLSNNNCGRSEFALIPKKSSEVLK